VDSYNFVVLHIVEFRMIDSDADINYKSYNINKNKSQGAIRTQIRPIIQIVTKIQ
jgi:hypothetical protein